MNFRLSSLFITLGCIFLASCYPYDESQGKKPTKKQAQKSVTTAEQQKIQEQRDALKQKEAPKTPEAPGNTTSQVTPPVNTAPPGTSPQSTPAPTPPVEEKRPEYKFAEKVPGQEGFVLSPYNGKKIDVRGMPTGTLVQDPTYTGAGKGYFRVP
jgi:hypothetical protein